MIRYIKRRIIIDFSVLFFFAFFFFTPHLKSQVTPSSKQVSVEVISAADKIKVGGIAKFAVVLNINHGWHINSHMPGSEDLISTVFSLDQKEGIILIDVSYPEGKYVSFSFSNKPIQVYEGEIKIFISIKISDKLTPKNDVIKGYLTFQACNDKVCIAPSTIELDIPIQIVNDESQITHINKEIFAAYNPDEQLIVKQSNPVGTMFEEKGYIIAFLAIFILGLALNLTPCVYPMISVTVSLFGTQTDQKIFRIFLKAVIYVLGIATMYSILGVTAAFSGGLFGGWLQSPWVLVGIALLLFLLALSSFGLYHIQLPYWLTSRIGISKGTGLIALYLSGLVVGIFAAPCAGPPVIALLTFVATSGSTILGFWIFFIFALGLGFPYLILGTFSGLLRKIPKSGSWLIWVEHIFGVILVGAGLFYLMIAFSPKSVIYVIPLTLVGGGIYLGFIDSAGDENSYLRKVKRILGVIALIIGIMQTTNFAYSSMSWEKYSDASFNDAIENGVPVLIDFYADWCIPCIKLEQNTWTDPEVIQATKDIRRLKVDLTHFDSKESETIRKKFNISGVPTVVFIGPYGVEAFEYRIVGYVSPKEFLDRYKRAMSIE